MTSDAALTVDDMLRLYRMLLTIRLTEEAIADCIEVGDIRTPCHLCIGQEAVAVGVCDALEKTDTVWGGHRSHGHYLAKGGDLQGLISEVFVKTSGCSGGRGGSMHLFAPEVGILGTVPLVAATIPLAVGAALASHLKDATEVSVAFFGDGATEEGHFHESMNLAAVYSLPAIFVCENNLYASHLPIAERRRLDNIAASGPAHGIPSVVVDGNDVLAVRGAALEAVTRARRGEGPTLIEARTYRWRGHVGPAWDMDVGVKRAVELEEWMTHDPIGRLASVLASELSTKELDETRSEIAAAVNSAVTAAREAASPDDDVTLHVYADQEGLR